MSTITIEDPENPQRVLSLTFKWHYAGDEEEEEESPESSRSLLNMWSEDSRGGSDDKYNYDDFVVPDDAEVLSLPKKRLKKRSRPLVIDLVSSEEGDDDEVCLLE